MALTKEIPLDCGLTATCKEMTVGEVREWLKYLQKRRDEDGDIVGDALHSELRLFDLQFMSDLKPEHMDRLTQMDLNKLHDQCKELNPHFFDWVEKVLERRVD